MINNIKEDMLQALKDGDKVTLSTLRLLLSSLETEKSKRGLQDISEFTKDDVVTFINKGLKVITQETDALVKAGRDITKQEKEKEILMAYLPEQLTEDEIRGEVRHSLNLVKNKEYRNAMQYLAPKLKGKADMRLVMKILRDEQ